MNSNREYQLVKFLHKPFYTKNESNVTTEVYEIIVSNDLFSVEIDLAPQRQSMRKKTDSHTWTLSLLMTI
jgi:hypothetical protein